MNLHKLPKIPGRGQYHEEARKSRLDFIRPQISGSLEQVAQHSFEPKKLVGNIESFIGSVEIPVGVAGPLFVKGQHIENPVYIPMATTEGALVTAAIRGATVVSRSGGVTARVLGQRMIRVPLFTLTNLNEALLFAHWIKNHYQEIKEQTLKYSNHAELVSLKPEIIGRFVHVHFIYETSDAAGQNMTTTCTWHACLWIEKRIKAFPKIQIKNFIIEANLSNDKKVTYQSFIDGRGIRAIAECQLPFKVVERLLKVTPEQLVKAYQGFVNGSIAAGMVGVNINVANMIAAIFVACGQDIACVHESAIGQLYLELTEDNRSVYASLLLPSLIIGTVGGGTALPRQKECLEMMGCDGPGKVRRLAEIIVAASLALDLSTLAAIAGGQFALSHEKLGRNRPVDFLKLSHLNAEFLETRLRHYFQDNGLHVSAIELMKDVKLGSSIITELTAHRINKLVGHFPFSVDYTDSQGQKKRIKLMVKAKPLDKEVIIMINSMAAMCDPQLARAHARFREKTGFASCHIKELAVMGQKDARFINHAPIVYDTYENTEREAYVIVEEYMENMLLMDSANDVSGWTGKHINTALDGIAETHSIWLGREAELKQKPWLGYYPTRKRRVNMLPLWRALGQNAMAEDEHLQWFRENDLKIYTDISDRMDQWWAELETMPKTLVHNDFNPRNIAFRKTDQGLCLCAYDWELATIHVPQYDVAELLAFTLQPDVTEKTVTDHVEYHRLALQKVSGVEFDATQWRNGYRFALYDFLIGRLSLYFMAHIFQHFEFMERVYSTFKRLLEIEETTTVG
uniref:hydroxymethylglutaryl-CoA reductase (NADPH) n=1 Tax=Candidatus Kentrum eta TaxID=2126337 RepID=A0A450UFA9_9GAMM|nr:MAG: 3-hydroxy-3-methylglutaryl-coenzyme A reductase [Candidatus Kentron sp. H]VFJ92329.1 MAG: 3-hydroxy-3-methylglutaryl-coenzyme A reductase [Candidatus Kentron sp. H]VFJ98952.1 MAG: 3-hydroxy-3-methylglutaryl-coenzyme A reductase [Candidatus Kentron sp. H]